MSDPPRHVVRGCDKKKCVGGGAPSPPQDTGRGKERTEPFIAPHVPPCRCRPRRGPPQGRGVSPQAGGPPSPPGRSGPARTLRSTPAWVMAARRMTPPLEPSLAMASASAGGGDRQTHGRVRDPPVFPYPPKTPCPCPPRTPGTPPSNSSVPPPTPHHPQTPPAPSPAPPQAPLGPP